LVPEVYTAKNLQKIVISFNGDVTGKLYFTSAIITVVSFYPVECVIVNNVDCKPTYNFVNGHVSTMWFMVC